MEKSWEIVKFRLLWALKQVFDYALSWDNESPFKWDKHQNFIKLDLLLKSISDKGYLELAFPLEIPDYTKAIDNRWLRLPEHKIPKIPNFQWFRILWLIWNTEEPGKAILHLRREEFYQKLIVYTQKNRSIQQALLEWEVKRQARNVIKKD